MTSPSALNVRHLGRINDPAAPTFVMAHGYGCDQTMWHPVAELLPEAHCILFDWPGAGNSDPDVYDPVRHQTLDGYADDLIALLQALDLSAPIYVGHSVAASIGALAALRAPGLFGQLAMVAPTPCMRNDPPGYRGGFESDQLESLVAGLAEGHAAWSRAIAPVVMSNPERPELTQRLEESFCAMDPTIALRWARATFLSDLRPMMPALRVPCLLMQCSDDMLAPPEVGDWLKAHIPVNRLLRLQATGHCPHLSAPQEVASALLGHMHWRGER